MTSSRAKVRATKKGKRPADQAEVAEAISQPRAAENPADTLRAILAEDARKKPMDKKLEREAEEPSAPAPTSAESGQAASDPEHGDEESLPAQKSEAPAAQAGQTSKQAAEAARVDSEPPSQARDKASSASGADEPDSADDMPPIDEDAAAREYTLLASKSHHSSKRKRSRRHGLPRRRHRRHHHRKHHRSLPQKVAGVVLKVVLVLVLVLAIVAVACVAYLYNSVKSGEDKILAATKLPTAVSQAASSSDSDSDSAEQAEHLYTPVLNNTITYNGKTYTPNKKMVSIAFIGFDGGDTGGTVGQADTVMLFTLNLETGSAKVISVPRDSMVDVSEYVGSAYVGQDTMQLCLAYSYGDGADSSSEHVADLVSRILYDVPVSYYFTLNYQGVAPLNDSVGGVTLTALQTVQKSENIVEGETTTLTGDDALLYVRWRDTSDDNSSIDRQDRQMQYISAFFQQVVNAAKSNPSVLVDLYNIASEYSYTNLDQDEFTYLGSRLIETGISSLEVVSLPGTMTVGDKYAEYYLDKEGVRQVVLDTFYHEVTDTDYVKADDLSELRGTAENDMIASEDQGENGEESESSAASNSAADAASAASTAGSSSATGATSAANAVESASAASSTTGTSTASATNSVAGTSGATAASSASGDATASASASDASTAQGTLVASARSAEDQAALEAANAAVAEAVANW